MEKDTTKNKNLFKGVGVIILYLFMTAFTYDFPRLFGINFNNLSLTTRQIYLVLYELFLTLLLIYIYKKDFIPNFIDFKKNIKEYIDKYIKYWFIMLGLMIASNIIVTMFTSTNVSNNQSTIIELLSKAPFYTIFVTIITAPIIEELIFRLSIRKIFKNDILFIIMSGLIFGSMHVIGNFNKPIDLLFIIPYSIPGFIFAYVYTKSKNICTTIGLHFLHNSVMVILQLIGTLL